MDLLGCLEDFERTSQGGPIVSVVERDGNVLRGSFDCGIVRAEEEREESDFRDSLGHSFRDDLWEKDFCMFCC